MGEATKLVIGGSSSLYIVILGFACVAGQVLFSYEKSVRVLKWLTLALFAYVAVLLTVQIPWKRVGLESIQPWLYMAPGTTWKDYAAMVVAVLGTTISPYLFFWQAAQEVEDNNRRPDAAELHAHPAYVAEHLARIKQDTFIGMIFSNLIAVCIVVATAVTLNLQGITNIQTSAQAALALKPIAGEFAFVVFALGIIGTGLLAVPVLAGSAAYAVSEALGWKTGLSYRFNEARGFYLIIIFATAIGSVMSFFEVDPMQTLLFSAVVNGVIAVPIMAAMLLIGQSKVLMGDNTITGRHRVFGWLATGVMAFAVIVMFATL
jgi:Mn2+/Fe2+ NRAMP family transporter